MQAREITLLRISLWLHQWLPLGKTFLKWLELNKRRQKKNKKQQLTDVPALVGE